MRATAIWQTTLGGNMHRPNVSSRLRLISGAVAAFLVGTVPGAHAAGPPYKIAVSNSYIGNGWRVQALNEIAAYAKKNYPGKVKLTINSSGEDVQKQIAAVQDMISQGVNAILINPASDSALNPVLQDAVDQGILVVAWDNNVTLPAAYNVNVDFIEMTGLHAQWMADTLGGKGNIIINRGVAGLPADRDMEKGMMDVLKKYPDIHVVTEVYGKWDDGVTQAELTKALTAHPNVDGILNEAGEYGALQALLNLKYKLVPMTGQGGNGWRVAMMKYKDQGLKGLSAGDPTIVGAYALKTAVDILDGKGPADKHVRVKSSAIRTEDLVPGKNVFPNAPNTMYADFEIPGFNAGLSVEDALGKNN
jgi:ribose transport system substrate-binding protein